VRLAFRGPAGTGTFDLGERRTISIGRSPNCDLVLPDDRASRVHATIERIESQHLVRDAGSSNGTFLNGLRVTGASFSLRDNDVIEIGSTRLVYSDGVEVATPAPPPASAVLTQTSFPMDELVRDGYARLEADTGDACTALALAFQQKPPRVALRAAAEVLVKMLAATNAGVFLRRPEEEMRLLVGYPSPEHGDRLITEAGRAYDSAEGRAVMGVSHPTRSASLETVSEGLVGTASVPLRSKGKVVGAVVVERVRGSRIDRTDLALLAVVAERIVKELADLEARNPHDTSVGGLALAAT
jgi:pSer/pThr/pTyr-binding forkhead associated (FHA) protein